MPASLRAPVALAQASALALALLAGCTQSADEVRARHDGGASQSSAAQSAVRSALPPRNNDADFVAAVATSKQALPFTVRFRLDSRPRVGQPVTVDVMVTPATQVQIRSLKFRFEPGEGLQFDGDPEFVVNGATPDISVHRELQVTPRTAGLLELQARAVVETSSEALSQVYAIPLIVVANTP